jgi:hypothetical protein
MRKILLFLMVIALGLPFIGCEKDEIINQEVKPNYPAGVYLGVIGFNETLSKSNRFVNIYKDQYECKYFIDGLSTANNTGLYYAMREGVSYFDKGGFPDDVSDVYMVTFTDGLDNVSGALAGVDSKEEVKSDVVNLFETKQINGKKIKSYTIGIGGSDLSGSDLQEMQNELEELSSGDGYSVFPTNFYELGSAFSDIATEILQLNVERTLTCNMPAEDDGTIVRWTFDGTYSAATSTHYIEGEVNKENGVYSIINLHYVGVDASNEVSVSGVLDGVASVKFTFNDFEICPYDESIIKFYRQRSDYTWQLDSESGSGSIVNERVEDTSIAVMLVLDCSSSLGNNFSSMKTSAKEFIDAMIYGYEYPEPASEDCDLLSAIDKNFIFEAPQDFSATMDVDSVTLSWKEVYSATSYKVYRSTTASGVYSLLGSSLTNTYVDKNVTLGNTYYYKVSATKSGEETNQSDAISVSVANIQSITSLSDLDSYYNWMISGGIFQNTDISDNGEAYMTFTANRSGTLSFNYKTSTENAYDYLKLYINNSYIISWSGVYSNYYSYSRSVNTGDVIKIGYYKDYMISSGDDAVYIKDIVIE